MLDVHCHVLPGIDDGCRDVEESLKLLIEQARQGVNLVVATPHFYPDRMHLSDFLRKRETALETLNKAMEESEQQLPKLMFGSELRYFEGMSRSDLLDKLKIQGTDCILVEMPFSGWSERNIDDVGSIYEYVGLIPIIAHIERYFSPHSNKKLIEKLFKKEVYIQTNASQFIDRKAQKQTLKLFADGKINFMGSDSHNLDVRPPNIALASKIIAERFGVETLQEFAEGEYEMLGVRRG